MTRLDVIESLDIFIIVAVFAQELTIARFKKYTYLSLAGRAPLSFAVLVLQFSTTVTLSNQTYPPCFLLSPHFCSLVPYSSGCPSPPATVRAASPNPTVYDVLLCALPPHAPGGWRNRQPGRGPCWVLGHAAFRIRATQARAPPSDRAGRSGGAPRPLQVPLRTVACAPQALAGDQPFEPAIN